MKERYNVKRDTQDDEAKVKRLRKKILMDVLVKFKV